eukprot:35941_1
MSIELGLSSEKETLVDEEEQTREDAYLNKKIKKAFRDGDAVASRKYHESKQRNRLAKLHKTEDKYTQVSTRDDDRSQLFRINIDKAPKKEHTTQESKHKGSAGEFIKSIIFGGLDGIITLFAIVASISGSNLNVETVLVLGFAKLVGDGISMGIGDFLSEKAEIDFTKSEYRREKWEFDNYRDGEIKEMIDIYRDKGISETDAKVILTTMAKYPEFFLDHMMMQELELDSSVMDDNPIKNGGITFVSFLVFGTVPLLSYVVFHGMETPPGQTDWKLIIAVILTCLTLFGMGAVKGHYCNNNILKSGFFVMMNGALAAGAAYVIGWALSQAIHG